MDKTENPVLITGIGLLSSLGEGTKAHWEALNNAKPMNIDQERFAPYPVHALGEVDWPSQISRRDMRQMEPWQQIGTYAAGLALDDAKAAGDEDLCGKMDMIIAAGGGERDVEVDGSIISEARTTENREAMLNERLSNDLRPTLFLAQLSNLLAGNISIVHKVTGSSRTFMGEEGAGISAVKTAHARIASGQSEIALVGGSFNGEREDMLLLFELGQYLAKGDHTPIWSRKGETSGFNAGSVGAFLILESAEHAQKRGVKAYGELAKITADHGSRENGGATQRLNRMIGEIELPDDVGVLSAASGVEDITTQEADWLRSTLPDAPVRAFSNLTGNGMEVQFPLGIALAAMAVKRHEFYKPSESSEVEAEQQPASVLVTTIGHYRSEGLGLVRPVQA